MFSTLKSDTDSLFIHIGKFFDQYLSDIDWMKFSDDTIIKYVLKIANIIEKYVNNSIFNDVQIKNYNSNELEFKIEFKQEIIAKTILFIKKKKYAAWHVNEEGAVVDNIKVTGLEIVRSDSPELVRPLLKDIMNMILKKYPDKDISDKVQEYKKELLTVPPEGLSINIGVHDLKKYIDVNNNFKKGTPMHIKSVANYRKLLGLLDIVNDYEDIMDDMKTKVIYLKKNQYGFESMAFTRWPKEFDKVIQIDKNKQIEKVFTNKIDMLLTVINKSFLLKNNTTLNLFFGG